MKEISNKQNIDELLTRGVAEFIDPEGLFRKKLEAKVKGELKGDLIIKLGADPTRPDLHLGHAVILRKLKKFQELGCKVVFIVGDFTTLIGDPTGKNKARPKVKIQEEINKTSSQSVLGDSLRGDDDIHEAKAPNLPTSEEIAKNMKTYLEQIKKTKILDTSEENFSWIRNSDWFLNTTDMVYGPDAKAVINIELKEKEKTRMISVNINPNSFLGKTILFEKTRMQAEIRPGQITLVTLRGLLWTLQHITHSRLIDRDMFQERIKKGEELYVNEMLYPVIQGIDSHEIAQVYGSCDMEVGGTDQKFNMLVGRDVMKVNNLEPQSVLTFEVLEGLDGKEKMSKSLDNYIGITDSPEDMFGKIMSIPDELITKYFLLCTDTPMDIIEGYTRDMVTGAVNPRDLKMILGKEIIEIYHSKKSADKAEENFIATFQNKEIPKDLEEIKVKRGTLLVDVFLENNIVSSKTEFRRLVDEHAITNLDINEKVTNHTIEATSGVYRVGKKRFCKIITK